MLTGRAKPLHVELDAVVSGCGRQRCELGGGARYGGCVGQQAVVVEGRVRLVRDLGGPDDGQDPDPAGVGGAD